jgi:hypothetical protein
MLDGAQHGTSDAGRVEFREPRSGMNLPRICIDSPALGVVLPRSVARIQGWAMTEAGPCSRIDLTLDGLPLGAAQLGDERPDVKEATGLASARLSGFHTMVDLSEVQSRDGWVELGGVATGLDGVVLPVEPWRFRIDALRPGSSPVDDVAGKPPAWTEIQTVMSWIRDAATIEPGPLVSITIATRDRPRLLSRAVSSVLEQSYRHLELLIVDDSDRPTTRDAIEGMDDPRVRVLRTPQRRGPGAAFNIGLAAARGDLIAFLDDDNIMHRDWLRSIVWAFDRHPEVGALYGARILEDTTAAGGATSPGLPTCDFTRYDRRAHEQANFVDRNALALRSTHAGVLYDEQLVAGVDWDHSLRLFSVANPLALPAIACYYRTSGPRRITDRPDRIHAIRTVRSRAHQGRPLRVHVHCRETSPSALEADLQQLTAAGARITLSVRDQAQTVGGISAWQLGLRHALSKAQPDLVLLGSEADAAAELEPLQDHQVPFTLRARAAAASSELAEQIEGHPLALDLIDGTTAVEPAIRDALTRWLYERA